MYTLLNDTVTTRLQMTDAMRDDMLDIVDKWVARKGAYESTLLKGVWHYYCDSGIITDAFSVKDARIVDEKLAHLIDDDGIESDEWFSELAKLDIECNDVFKMINDICNKYDDYKDADEDIARELMFMEDDLLNELQNA